MLALAAVGSLTVTSPAEATYYGNAGSPDPVNGQYLSISGSNQNGGDRLVVHTYTGLTTQLWTEAPDSFHSGLITLLSGMHPPPPNMNLVAGVQAANMVSGTALIDWKPTADLNQGWLPMLWSTDPFGASCFIYLNADSSRGQFLMGVPAGGTANNQTVAIRTFTGAASITLDEIWCKYKWDPTQNKLVPE